MSLCRRYRPTIISFYSFGLIVLLSAASCGKGPLNPETLGGIVFAARHDSTTQLYTINPDGTNLRQITGGQYSYIAARWSPDGRRLAVMSDKDRLNHEALAVHLMNADGSGMRLLTRPGAGPVWSPDNTRIALSKDTQFEGYGSRDVVIFNVDGSNERNLTNTPFDDFVTDWSPDGTKLLIGSEDPQENPEGDFELYIIDLQGHRLARLTDNDVLDNSARWSPDGTRIAYISFGDRNQSQAGIYIMNGDGSGKRRIQNAINSIFINELAWLPTGDRIVFTSGGDLYTVKTDGTDLSKVISGRSIGSFDWRR